MSQSKIDEIVNMIDSFMANNGGHLNVSVDETGKVEADSVEVDKTVSQLSLRVWIEQTINIIGGI